MPAQFSRERVPAALTAGAALGGILTALALATVNRLGPSRDMPLVLFLSDALVLSSLVALVATIYFAVGLVTVGAPGWYLLRRAGFKSQSALALFGAIATGIANYWLFPMDKMFSYDTHQRLENALLMSVVGAIVGAAMWRIANRAAP